MLDIKLLRKESAQIEKRLRTKDPSICLAPLLDWDEEIRRLLREAEELKNKRNSLSKEIGQKKDNKDESARLMQEVSGLGESIAQLDHQRSILEEKLHFALAELPNLPEEGIQVSLDPQDNVCIKTFREKPFFAFSPKNHVELNEKLHLFDFKRGVKLAGSGWTTYRNIGARLEWALLNYMIDIHLEKGFCLWMVPHLVKSDILFGSGQLPKFASQVFKIPEENAPLYLLPTAEVALNGLHYDEILHEEELPLKYVAYSPCFRREAGAAGSQERGLIRTHQFNKVEMFCLTTPEQSAHIFEEMVASAEQILEGLNLHYRSMLLVTGDSSFASARTVDVEVWLPGQNRYYEVSSISNCTDFQARRSHIRFKRKEQKPELVHTLNGSGLATSRLMVALLENNQREDGSIALPQVLHKYLNGVSELR